MEVEAGFLSEIKAYLGVERLSLWIPKNMVQNIQVVLGIKSPLELDQIWSNYSDLTRPISPKR